MKYALPIISGSAAGPGITHQSLTQFTELMTSPDARKIAPGSRRYLCHGARDGGRRPGYQDLGRITGHWAPDPRTHI